MNSIKCNNCTVIITYVKGKKNKISAYIYKTIVTKRVLATTEILINNIDFILTFHVF